MKGQIAEINGSPRHLSLFRGFMIIEENDAELGRLDLDHILSVIVSSRGASLTTSLIAECAHRNIPIVLCDNRHQPSAIMTPIDHHSDQNRRYHSQALTKKGKRNQIWQAIVRAKIANQSAVLKSVQSPMVERLKRIRSGVLAGDSSNAEAHAAQVYWPALFGEDFRRDKDKDGVNALLNYGYAIIRSAMVRAILASGLHPSFGLHHSNRKNAFCLADDLMEPYRPIVDQLVHEMMQRGLVAIDPGTKSILAGLVLADVATAGALSPLSQSMLRLCQSFNDALDGEKTTFEFVDILTPVELSSLFTPC